MARKPAAKKAGPPKIIYTTKDGDGDAEYNRCRAVAFPGSREEGQCAELNCPDKWEGYRLCEAHYKQATNKT